MRRAFTRILHISPTEYRERFRAAKPRERTRAANPLGESAQAAPSHRERTRAANPRSPRT
ncbi:hypothetical protein ACLESD_22865 [Pyxidicoccus sp. 3LFB2]